MITDYRIVGRPYRGCRRTTVMQNGFNTREEAEAFLALALKEGACDPDAFIRGQRVKQKPEQVNCISDEITLLQSMTEEQRQAIGN